MWVVQINLSFSPQTVSYLSLSFFSRVLAGPHGEAELKWLNALDVVLRALGIVALFHSSSLNIVYSVQQNICTQIKIILTAIYYYLLNTIGHRVFSWINYKRKQTIYFEEVQGNCYKFSWVNVRKYWLSCVSRDITTSA